MQPTRTRSLLALSCLAGLLAIAAIGATSNRPGPILNSEQGAALDRRAEAMPVPTAPSLTVSPAVDSFVTISLKIADALGVMPAPLGAESMTATSLAWHRTPASSNRQSLQAAFDTSLSSALSYPSPNSLRLQRADRAPSFISFADVVRRYQPSLEFPALVPPTS